MAQKNKIIISTRDCDSLGDRYSPFCCSIEVFQMLLKVHNDVLLNEAVQHYLLSLKWHDSEINKDKAIFTDSSQINYSMFVDNKHFINWMTESVHLQEFLEIICKTNDKYLIRKNKHEDIYVSPLIHDDFSADNIKYIETLVKSLKGESDDIYLLLHDKDLFIDTTRCYRVKICDVSDIISITEYPMIFELVRNNRVFVYYHNSGMDVYYDGVIQKLKDGITTNEIVARLNK